MTLRRSAIRPLVKLALVVLVAVGAMGFAAPAASAQPVNLARSGSHGYWFGHNTWGSPTDRLNQCFMTTPTTPTIATGGAWISRSPSYPALTQTVYIRTDVERWDGRAWVSAAS